MHIKRNNIPTFWAMPRKGTKYIAVASHNKNESIPMAVVARDMLKIVRNSKELKRALNEKKILVNQKIIRDTNFPVGIFDIISIPSMKKNYKATLSAHKKIVFHEVSNKEAESKIFKIIGRKILSGGKVQLNLSCGRNLLSKEKARTGDSALFNLKENKIEKIIKIEKGSKAAVIQGKHAGLTGKIEEIVERGGKSLAKIQSEKGKINVWTKNIYAIE